jgi:pyridoxal phosphate enzyme (YggS family)
MGTETPCRRSPTISPGLRKQSPLPAAPPTDLAPKSSWSPSPKTIPPQPSSKPSAWASASSAKIAFTQKSAELTTWVPQVSNLRPGTSTSIRSQIRAHLIGHLQSNKASKAVEIFDSIDSLDSLKLAEKLDEAAASLHKRLPVLLEIKLSQEESKTGLAPDSPELAELLERLPSLANLEVQGLMTIAPFNVPEAETRACFRSLRQLRDKLAPAHSSLNLRVLSMGMSGDFALAIAEGATRIRVGTALFGPRPGYPQ